MHAAHQHRGRHALSVAALVAAGLFLLPASGTAQLRPLEAMDWIAFEAEVGSAFVGVAGFRDHPASLLGSEGRLLELGLVGASFRSGRIVLAFQGSVVRVFEPFETFAEPLPQVEADDGARRSDSGDYRVSTSVRLTSLNSPWNAALRFGARLPTTDDRVGLERDRTDFFTTFAGRHRRGQLSLEAEVGFAINGVATTQFDQTDPILYGAGVVYRWPGAEGSVRLAGHYDTRTNGPPRGNEHLSELNAGVRTMGDTWVQAEVVRGLAEFSPAWGFQLRVGRSF